MKTLPTLEFYVYAYMRDTDSITAKAGTPYYIGKGTKKRMFNKHFTQPKDRRYIIILEANLTEIGAFAIERRMIEWYGRKDLGTGILNNRTDGGEGCSGRILSEESKKKMSIASKGKPKSEEHRKKSAVARKGKKSTIEVKEKIRKTKEASPYRHSDESKQKMSLSQKGIPRTHKTRGIPTKPLAAMRPVKTPNGEFISCAEAGRSHNLKKDTVRLRCKSDLYIGWEFL
jgi:hypothetical protein